MGNLENGERARPSERAVSSKRDRARNRADIHRFYFILRSSLGAGGRGEWVRERSLELGDENECPWAGEGRIGIKKVVGGEKEAEKEVRRETGGNEIGSSSRIKRLKQSRVDV